ncbi:DUF7824 domain-containing protein [Streptomyces cadmiisoli]|uniref:DUF7824 domain-containing protein n=1 Tax=Streptomyces cadmiisoli TaxID=2184053 RepID=UPI003664151D
MSSLMAAVRAGRTAETVSLLDGLTDTERRACFPELKELRKELRTAPWNAMSRRALPALHVAGAACQTGAAGVASWVAAADMRWSRVSPALLLHVLGDRDTDWLADVTHRLAQRPVSASVPYELMAGLVRLSGCPVPTTEAYVRGWVGHHGGSWQRGGTLCDRLRSDPHLRLLAAALFETADIGGTLEWPNQEGPDSWTGALAQLTAVGALDRSATVDACVARLLRGGPTTDQRVFLRLLKTLALTRDEEHERIADWLALASDGTSTIASHAQSVLGALALDGELTPRHLADLSDAVLFRTERKLVRTQLVLLGKVLTRDRTTADELLPSAAQAFGHSDSDVQERALKLVERHADRLSSAEARAVLVAAAEQLIPGLRVRAARALGVSPTAPEPVAYEEVLPPAPEPTRLPPAPETVEELAEEVGAALATEPTVADLERVLDGLVRHWYGDRESLLEALEPVTSRRWWDDAEAHWTDRFGSAPRGLSHPSEMLDIVLATLRGKLSTATLHSRIQRGTKDHGCVHSALSRALESRVWNLAHRIRTDPMPFLLSTPTWGTGLLDPAELVQRLDTYQRLGARVSDADFAQALLRVRRGDREEAASAARGAAALGSSEGTRLARWLVCEAPVSPVSRRRTSGSRVLIELGEVMELQAGLPAEFHPLGRPVSAFGESRYCHHWSSAVRPYWLAVLPERRELVAARLLRDLSALAVDDTRGAAAILPLLAEADGEAGEAVHLGVAYGLGARYPEDRLAAVDALLVLAARGQLDGARLGADLGQLIRRGAVKPQRLAESVRNAAATGATSCVWGILRNTLPVLLADLATAASATPPRGLGDLLAVAAECAERSGARGELPHLAQTADRRGASRLVTQARRLRSSLAGELAA